ncbi:hypothetical protein GGE65_007718 [Skermanella aerolata]|uniref:hypothetical protein n=1 Tax=Skermanella aerolata TaxID=393310 RepID=UPI003D1B9E7B
MSNVIRIPYEWEPRPHQLALWQYLENGGKRACVVWHRRGGKDSTAGNWLARASMTRVGVYWHMLPEASQGRKAVWEGVDRAGRRIIDQFFPPALRASTSDRDMRIRLKNGSVYQVVGSDNFDSLVGTNPVGIVFSEYSLANPAAWDYLRPILAENGGFAVFVFTPRGKNHGYELYEMAKSNPDWFCQRLTVEDTCIIPPEVISAERAAGMSDDKIRQEFYCSFDAAIVGAYYGSLMTDAEDTGRITQVPYDPAIPVETWWDLGVRDSTTIWFAQRTGNQIRLIDYYENSGQGLSHYIKHLQDLPYVYSRHVAPHDVKVMELGSGVTRWDTARQLGVRFEIAPKSSLSDGIQAVRQILPRCWFDAEKTKKGVAALKMYRREYDDRLKTYHDRPVHDWASHASDAFRYGAVSGDAGGSGAFWSDLTYQPTGIA